MMTATLLKFPSKNRRTEDVLAEQAMIYEIMSDMMRERGFIAQAADLSRAAYYVGKAARGLVER